MNMLNYYVNKRIKKMMRSVLNFLWILVFVVVLPVAWAEWEEGGDVPDKKSAKEVEEIRTRQERSKMKQWLQKLNSLKGSKQEGPLLSVVSKILSKDPNHIVALNTLGVFYLKQGKLQLAKIIFTRALKTAPKNSSLHGNMATIYLKEGKRKEAIEAFQKSLSYRYSNYASAANLSALYMQAYEYDAALEYLSLAYNRAKQNLSVTHPEVMKTGNNYAVALAWSGDFGKSEDVFRELLKSYPDHAELLLNYALLLGRDIKNKDKSNRFLNKANLMDSSGRYSRRIKALKKYLREGDNKRKKIRENKRK